MTIVGFAVKCCRSLFQKCKWASVQVSALDTKLTFYSEIQVLEVEELLKTAIRTALVLVYSNSSSSRILVIWGAS